MKIKWDVTPYDAMDDRKNLLLASGDYPEVFLEAKFTKTDQMKYGKQGALLPLNDLIEKFAPNIKKALAEIPYLKDAITSPDGNIYALPRINECYHCSFPYKYWINEEWLNNVGMSMPTTTDELYNVLKAFKEKDPNKNGKKDEIPLTGGPSKYVWGGNIDGFLMNSFIYNDNDKYLLLKNGTVDFAANKPEWKQGLEYLHKLYSEGLIDPAAFTQNAEAVGQIGNNKDVELVGSFTAAVIGYLVSMDEKETRQKHWTIVPPLQGPNGFQTATFSRGIGNSVFAITSKATPEQQEAAIKVADYMMSEEGTLLAETGVTEGQGWAKAKEGDIGLNGQPAKWTDDTGFKPDPNKVLNDRWQLMGPMRMDKNWRESWATPQDPLTAHGYELRLKQATDKYAPFEPTEAYPTDYWISPEDVDIEAQLKPAIQDYVVSSMAQFITGSKDIAKDWDSYVKGFEGLQLDKYLEIYQKAIKK